MPYQVILFDLDDTLVDFATAEDICLRKIHAQYYQAIDYSFFETHFQIVNDELWQRVGADENPLLPGDVRFMRFKQVNERMNYEASHTEIANTYEFLLGEHTDWLPEVKKVVEFLHQKGHILGIITNGLTDSQARKRERLELHRWFDCYIVSDEVGLAKPQKGIFDLALDALVNKHEQSFSKDSMLMVGDSLMNDGHGAMNFGIKYCHVNRYSAPLPPTKALLTHHIQSVAQLPDSLGYEGEYQLFATCE
jgi:2-haloacid dehalogenase/putative hydrolase of the HAD superfamily